MYRPTSDIRAAWVLAALLLAASTARAEPLLVATDTQTQSLYRLDPATGDAMLIGSFDAPGVVTCLAYSRTDCILFGVTADTQELVSIDWTTGTVTAITRLRTSCTDAFRGRLTRAC